MRNFRLTLSQKYGYTAIFSGISFILLALVGKSSSLLNLIASVGFLLALLLKSEIDDERALDNLHRAGYRAFLMIICLISILECIVLLCRVTLDVDTMFRLILGISFSFFGYYFLYFERK